MSKLTHGAPLEVEDLDLSNFGMYNQDQKDKLLKEGVPEDDFFLNTIKGTTRWARKSDKGKIWQTYNVGGLKRWKDLIKK